MKSLIVVMTNITLSIEKSVYQKMKQYSEIKWSEFVRKCIKQRIDQLDTLEHTAKKKREKEEMRSMQISEEVLKKDWDNETDERWNHV